MEQVFGKDFEKIERRVGTVIELDDFVEARKASDRLENPF